MTSPGKSWWRCPVCHALLTGLTENEEVQCPACARIFLAYGPLRVESLDDLCLNVPAAAGVAFVRNIEDDAWELQEPDSDPRSPFARLLAEVIDGLRLDQWRWQWYISGHFMEEALASWLNDRSIPSGWELE